MDIFLLHGPWIPCDPASDKLAAGLGTADVRPWNYTRLMADLALRISHHAGVISVSTYRRTYCLLPV